MSRAVIKHRRIKLTLIGREAGKGHSAEETKYLTRPKSAPFGIVRRRGIAWAVQRNNKVVRRMTDVRVRTRPGLKIRLFIWHKINRQLVPHQICREIHQLHISSQAKMAC